jgi:hypothetical protein
MDQWFAVIRAAAELLDLASAIVVLTAAVVHRARRDHKRTTPDDI